MSLEALKAHRTHASIFLVILLRRRFNGYEFISVIFHRSATGSKIFTRGNKKWRGSPARASPLLCFAGQHQLRPSRELWREITRETTRRKLLITRYWTDVSCFRLSIELPDSFRERRAANSTSYLHGDNVIFTVAVNYFQKKKNAILFPKKKKERKRERKDGKLDYSFEKLRRETFATKRIEQIYKFQEISGKGEIRNFPVKFHRFLLFSSKDPNYSKIHSRKKSYFPLSFPCPKNTLLILPTNRSNFR